MIGLVILLLCANISEGWLPVQLNKFLEWDLESTPLEIRTNSMLGSDDGLYVRFYSAEGGNAGEVSLSFRSTLQYYLGWCSPSWTNLPVTLPSATDKVWRFTLTKTAGVRLVIHCNEVEVLNILLSQALCRYSEWSTVWNRDVKKISFRHDDTASDYYGTQTGWLPVQLYVSLEWDLESTPLEIRTNSMLGSNDRVRVIFYSAEGEHAGQVSLFFRSTLQYDLNWCSSSYYNLPVAPPSATDKVWRITLTRTAGVRLVIYCNDVEVLNTLLSQECRVSFWSTVWNRDVKKISFIYDTASDYYRTQTGPCEEGTYRNYDMTSCETCDAGLTPNSDKTACVSEDESSTADDSEAADDSSDTEGNSDGSDESKTKSNKMSTTTILIIIVGVLLVGTVVGVYVHFHSLKRKNANVRNDMREEPVFSAPPDNMREEPVFSAPPDNTQEEPVLFPDLTLFNVAPPKYEESVRAYGEDNVPSYEDVMGYGGGYDGGYDGGGGGGGD